MEVPHLVCPSQPSVLQGLGTPSAPPHLTSLALTMREAPSNWPEEATLRATCLPGLAPLLTKLTVRCVCAECRSAKSTAA